jgi:ankyrin repeat protein
MYLSHLKQGVHCHHALQEATAEELTAIKRQGLRCTLTAPRRQCMYMSQSTQCLRCPHALQEATAEELAEIKRQRLHTTCNADGWNALHYAVATHKVKLVQQLLDIGASPRAAVAELGLLPLHLACMGCVEDVQQFNRLVETAGSLYDLQVRRWGCFRGACAQLHMWCCMY